MLTDFDKLSNALNMFLFSSESSGTTLQIIDDYNLGSNISYNKMEEFVKAISSVTKVKTVEIYIQDKGPTRRYYPPSHYWLFRTDIRKQAIDDPKAREKTIARINAAYNKKIKFIDDFSKFNISCEFIVYPTSNVRPAFHGRYWLSSSGGLIVDGSLNTTENSLVLAQVMDAENYWLVRERTEEMINYGAGAIHYDRKAIIDAYQQAMRDMY